MATSPSQARHLKCIIGVMKPLIVILLLAISVQAQSIADAARKERERQANARPGKVVISTENPVPAAPAAGTGLLKVETPAAPDPVKAWNDKMDELRKKIQTLGDQETALTLQIGQLSNQLFALVTDPDTQARVQSQLGQANQQLVSVRADLQQTRNTIDSMQAAGSPKPIEVPKPPEAAAKPAEAAPKK